MGTIDVLTVALPLSEAQIERLQKKLPQTEIIMSEFSKGKETEVQNADVILGNTRPDLLKCCQKLKWMHLGTSGADYYVPYIPVEAALTTSTGVYGPAIGEFMVAVLMALQKKLPAYGENQKGGVWQNLGMLKSFEDCTCLVLGLGDIGENFAQRVKALGARVVGVRRVKKEKPDFVDEMYLSENLLEILPEVDVVAMALPNTSATTNIMSAEAIAAMKPGSILINVGRGTTIDQDALMQALESGHLFGAAIDVAVPEPLPADHPLWKTKNLIITPHISGQWTLPSIMERTLDLFEKNVDSFIQGLPLENMVDYETGYRKSL